MTSELKYFDELKRTMEWLGTHEESVFLGQAVAVPGTAMSNTLTTIAREKIIELPVAEEMQMGMSIGLALSGWIPVSIFPRWNFLLLATNQLVNHLDKIRLMSDDGYQPKVIIRTAIGSERPLHPQFQHIGDFSNAFSEMLTNVEILRLEEADEIFPAYKLAYERGDGRSTLIVEYGDYYSEK